MWQQACENFNGEQLAYIAALATGAHLVFGDRPKHITYRRLWDVPTLHQLDEAFACQAIANYQEYYHDIIGKADAAGGEVSSMTNCADDIMMKVRG